MKEEIVLMKKDTESSARADTMKADLKDKYNALMLENKSLQKQVASKFNTEKFNSDSELQDARGKLSVAEAKNLQLEKRMTTLEARLDGQEDSEVIEAAMKDHAEEVAAYENEASELRA